MLSNEETIIFEAIKAARTVQTFLWGEHNQQWGIEEWRRMFKKRMQKIDDIDTENPYALIELRKRLLQNAALSIALIKILDTNGSIKEGIGDRPSNLGGYV